MRKYQKWAWLGLLVVIIVAMFAVFVKAQAPQKDQQEQAVALAKKYAKLEKPTAFYTYHRKKTFYTVDGIDQQKRKIYVLINEKHNHVTIYRHSDGITKNDALTQVWAQEKPQRVLNINFGSYHNKPVWEIVYKNKKKRLCYLTLDFKTGKTVQLIENL